MKKLFFLFVLFPLVLSAQEKYFHELKGMEDSTGTTHLFYRVATYETATCNYYEQSSSNNYTINPVYHFNTSTNKDNILLSESSGYSFDCTPWGSSVDNYYFPTSSLDSLLVIRTTGGGLQLGQYLVYGINKTLDLGLGNAAGIISDPFQDWIILNTPYSEVIVKRSNFSENLKKSFVFTPEVYPDYYSYRELEDSLLIDFTVTAISPFHKGVYFGIKNDAIVYSDDFGATYDSIAVSTFNEYDGFTIGRSYFDHDSSAIYMQINDEVYLLIENQQNWSFVNLSDKYQVKQFALSNKESESFYFSIGDSLYKALELGEVREPIIAFDNQITGLYSKPNSNTLYVLTNDELFELDTETKEVISLKKLPVSNEETKETPSSVKLHQNYPNPFNPTTTISFDLDKPAEITLTVFDALGRTVSVLVDERRTAGLHEVRFDATQLSSGIYFYRLEAGNFVQTKTLTLIK